MRTKLHLLKVLVWKQVRNNHGILILIELWWKTKQWYKKYKKMSILYPKTSKESYHHINFLKSIMNSRSSIKKQFLKISKYSQKSTCIGIFFNKNAGLQAFDFIKQRLQHIHFLDNSAKFLRTAILKNVCERLLLRVFPFMLATWTNDIASYLGREGNTFSKIKQKVLF